MSVYGQDGGWTGEIRQLGVRDSRHEKGRGTRRWTMEKGCFVATGLLLNDG